MFLPTGFTGAGQIVQADCIHREVEMKDVYEVLRQKEMDLARLRKEIEALRLVIPLLANPTENSDAPYLAPEQVPKANRWPLQVGDPTMSMKRI
jgi:hypothetical protein